MIGVQSLLNGIILNLQFMSRPVKIIKLHVYIVLNYWCYEILLYKKLKLINLFTVQ